MDPKDFLEQIIRWQEAYRILHGLPVERQFSDREIGPVVAELESIEAEIYGKSKQENAHG